MVLLIMWDETLNSWSSGTLILEDYTMTFICIFNLNSWFCSYGNLCLTFCASDLETLVWLNAFVHCLCWVLLGLRLLVITFIFHCMLSLVSLDQSYTPSISFHGHHQLVQSFIVHFGQIISWSFNFNIISSFKILVCNLIALNLKNGHLNPSGSLEHYLTK